MAKLLLLCSVSFGVSFGLSLLVNQDIRVALLTGLINLPATFLALVIVRKNSQRLPFNPIHRQIHQLESKKQQLIQSISATATEQHRIETNLNFLKAELSQMYAQIGEQRSQKQQLSQDLVELKESKNKLEAETRDLQTQINHIKQRREELYESVRSKRTEKIKIEARVESIPVQLQQLQTELADSQNQKQELEDNLAILRELHPSLEEKSQTLQTQVLELEQSKVELNQSLLEISRTIQSAEKSANSLKLELIELQEQVLEQQIIKEDLELELVSLNQKLRHYETDEDLQFTVEWHEFMNRLPKYELQVLKALIEPGNPNIKIKKIAEENITMPELLIDLLNERAVNIIGDLIIQPGKGSLPPEISEEYLTKVKQVVKVRQVN